jgi:hypothetical protein
MFANAATNWYYSNRNAQDNCGHCDRFVRHEKWCVTCNPFVQYAYGVVTSPERLTLRDRLILHALGVAWGNTLYQGEFQQTAARN